MKARLGLGAVLIAVALGASVSASPGASAGDSGQRPTAKSQLAPFKSCARLGDYARRHRRAAPIAAMPGVAEFGVTPGPAPEGAAPGAGAEASGSAPSGSDSGSSPTNVQEQGVDEPDLVKARGSTIFAIAENRLEAVDAGAGGPSLLGSLALPNGPGDDSYSWGDQLLVVGERALVVSNVELGRAPWTRTIISEIDIADPTAMSVVSTLSFEGRYVNARLTGTTARIVTSSTPAYPFAEPVPPARPSGARRGPRAWLPVARLRDRVSGELTRGPLARCGEIRRPQRFSGLELLSVLTIDLARGLDPIDTDAVMTTGEVVYGSPQALYVATERWFDPDDPDAGGSQVTTAIHKFAHTDAGSTEYVATGKVAGFMLSQWSMSEHEGLLRVASTSSPPWQTEGPRAESESFVTVLAQDSGRLAAVGELGGLGRDERIYAVRFIGEVGYVVTFRQVDPLYTVDLSDPAAPRLLGELKIPGYSAYLHPVAPGRLLGIGQDADADGRTLGVQASLFDVSDLTSPTQLDNIGFGRQTSTEVEYDHHAFLYWQPERLAVIPLEDYGGKQGEFHGAVAFRLDPDAGFEPQLRISHGNSWEATIRRSLVIGDRLFTVSARGVMAHDLTTLEPSGWAEFGAA